MNSYIVSGQGFLKSITINKETFKLDFEWSSSVRGALKFKSTKAKKFIEKHKFNAFVWNAYAEEPIRDRWKVVKRHDNYLNPAKILEWVPEKIVWKSRTDAKYLASNGNDSENEYSYDDALAICITKNMEILTELQEKINKMNTK